MKHASLPLLKRREFITLLGGAAAAWPLAARAQQPANAGDRLFSARGRRLDARVVGSVPQGLARSSA